MRHQLHDLLQRMLGQVLPVVRLRFLLLRSRQRLLVDTLLVLIVRLVVGQSGDVFRILGRVGIAFLLGPPVLEPHFDLSIRQIQLGRQYEAAVAGYVVADHKLLLQLLDLSPGIRAPRAGSRFACKKKAHGLVETSISGAAELLF